MIISATRRVTGSSGTNKSVTPHVRTVGNTFMTDEPNVETIDTYNKVSVNEDARREHTPNQQEDEKEQKRQYQNTLKNDQTLLHGAVEAMSENIVAEESQHTNRNKKLGVYNTNQNIYEQEENNKLDRRFNEHYIKHLYENNEPPEEIDELI